MVDRLGALSDEGVAIWLDDLSRARLTSGNLDMLRREKHVVGVTSNPTIFASALTTTPDSSDGYAVELAKFAQEGLSVDEVVRRITTADVRDACDVMRPTFEQTAGLDGRISLEVDPRLARDTAATIAEAQVLWAEVARENLFIKIPATKEGLPAITETLANGISVNVTLIFSLDRYSQVIDAFLVGLKKAQERGHDLSHIASVASFFVSRVDTEVDKRLDALGTPEAASLRGKAAIANARLAYQRYEKHFGSPRWEALRAKGARTQRPLWASTGVKDPSYSDTRYVTELVAPNTVNTMPEATLDAVEDHADITGNTIAGTYEASADVLTALTQLGIDYDDVVSVLEKEGVTKFTDSWTQLLDTVHNRLREI